MNGYYVIIATHAHFGLVMELQVKAASMDEAAEATESWMEENGFPLSICTYIIEQVSGAGEIFLVPGESPLKPLTFTDAL